MKLFPHCAGTKLGSLLALTALMSTAAGAGAQTSPKLAPVASASLAIPVTVTNTPLPVQGTVNANVTGTVGINSLPAVQLAGTPSVQLASSPTLPVYVDAERAARNGFNASCFTGNVDPVYGQASCSVLTIPAGRQVVLETISCQAELAAGQGPGDVQLIVPNTPFTPGGPDHVSHLLTLTKQAGDSSIDIWRMTSPLRAYGSAPAQGSVDIGVFFRANPSASVNQGILCTVSGYLVSQ